MTSTEQWTRTSSETLPEIRGYGSEMPLDDPGISLCGARGSGERGLDFGRAVGRLAAEMELPLISGYAKGVDLAGHVACVDAGGHTVAVLAEALDRFRLRRELQAVVDPWDDIWDRLTVVSEFEPQARWTVWRAMTRNDTICALGRVLVAIDPGETGGTLDAVKKAVKREMPVVIGWPNQLESHDHLRSLLSKDHVTLVTDGDDLISAIRQAVEEPAVVAAPQQAELAFD